MKKHRIVINTFFAVICAILINKTTYAEPANLSRLKQEIQAYHDSGAYHKELTQVMTHARDFIISRVEINAHDPHPAKLAVVLDVDETSLSNYDKMVAREFTGDREQIHREILAANSPVIEPMLSLYDDILKHGVTVFFVTGRHQSERHATCRNLKSAGYHDWAGLYLKPEHYHHASIIPFKSETRATISKLGYAIIASIGDQLSDLQGGYTEKTFKLPNPYYYLP